MASFIRLAAIAALAITSVSAQQPQPSTAPVKGSVTSQGCFSSSGTLKNMTDSLPKGMLNTDGLCGTNVCFTQGFKVAATQLGTECWCGNEYPSLKAVAEDKHCNVGCAGYDKITCGGEGYWTVYNTGKDINNVANAPDDTIKSSTTPGSTPSATAPPQQTTVIQSPSTSDEPKAAGPNVGGIVAGVVVGVLLIAGVAGGVFFYMRRKRNQEIEEEHRRNMAVNSFVKPPGSSGSFSDTRIDPGMAQRRMSSGSIDETQDYSRKILRVTNA